MMIGKIAILVLVIGATFFFFRKKKAKETEPQKEAIETPVEMKQDPVCGSFVEETTKSKVKYYDKIYYFCSDECKQKFIEQKKAENV